MDFETFKQGVKRTESVLPQETNINKPAICTLLLGISHLSNALDQMKKTTFYKLPANNSVIKEELRAAQLVIANLQDLIRHEEQGEGDSLLQPAPVLVGVENSMRLLHGLIGYVGEAGEIAAATANLLNGEGTYRSNILEEFGDGRFYKAVVFDVLGFNEDQEAQVNHDKLQARYGDKFSQEKAVNRDLDAEREILEKGANE